MAIQEHRRARELTEAIGCTGRRNLIGHRCSVPLSHLVAYRRILRAVAPLHYDLFDCDHPATSCGWSDAAGSGGDRDSALFWGRISSGAQE